MSQHRWKLFSIALIFLFLLSACGGSNASQQTPTPLPALVSYEQEVFSVKQGPIVSEAELLGEIVPAKQDQLFFRSSGFVTRITVKQGDIVNQGDVLAELQVDDLLAQLQQAQIDLDVAKADLEKFDIQQEFDLKRAQAEVKIEEINLEKAQLELENATGEMIDFAQLNYGIAQQNLVIAQQSLELKEQETNPYVEQVIKRNELAVQRLELLLAERQIIAPYDGIILRVNLREGEDVDGYKTVIDIGDPSDLVIRAQVDWDIRGKLSSSTETEMFISKSDDEANPSWPVQFLPKFLPISENEVAATQNSANNNFYFDLQEDENNEEFVVGRSVFLRLILGQKDDALLLPPAAIREYKGLYFVIVQDGERRRRVEITEIGLKSPRYWEISGDLNPGDKVVGP